MEENKKFRNHISIILEQTGAGFFVLLGIFLWNAIDDPEFLAELASGKGIFFIFGGLLVFGALLFGIQYFIWSKTYISIEGNSIVFEKNTLKREKKTIGIRNISNINTEQNMFEMLVGTCKVKMDTDSFSTADVTDLKIVLKKKDAEAFRDYILQKMNRQEEEKNVVLSGRKEEISGAGIREMLIHGFYSIRILSVVFALLCMAGFLGMVLGLFREGMDGTGSLAFILMLGLITGSAVWSICKEFLQYYGFFVERKGNRLHIQYGLLKKVDYTIPVEKINALRLIQTPHARGMKRCTVELINVGMGDDEEEQQSFFLMYDKEEIIKEKISALLPEFSEGLTCNVNRQPASVWKIWAVTALILIGFIGLIYAVTAELFSKYLFVVTALLMLLFFCVVLSRIMEYRTEGSFLGEELLGLCLGAFARERIFVKYDKIQYLTVKQNVFARTSGIAKAEIHLLASAAKSVHDVPYFPEEVAEQLKERILER